MKCTNMHERSLLAVCPFSALWRIVLEGRIVDSALSQAKHILMQLAHVAAGNDWGGILNYTATPRGMANKCAL